jgi:hypothetical protein
MSAGWGVAGRIPPPSTADVGREEFEKAHRSALAGGGDQFGQCRRGNRHELVHAVLRVLCKSRVTFAAALIPSNAAQTKTIARLRRRMSGTVSRSHDKSADERQKP